MTSRTSATATSPSPARVWIRRGIFGIAGLAVLYLGTAFALSRFLDPEELADWIEPRLESALSRDVDVGRVEVGFLPLGVRLRDLTVSDPTGLAPALVQVASLELRVRLLPLLRREVEVSRLAVDGVRADLRVSEEGRSNFGDLSTRQTEEPPTSPGQSADSPKPFALNLRSLVLDDGEIRFTDAGDSIEVEMTDLGLRASASRDTQGGWLLDGSTGGGLTFLRGGGAPILNEAPLELVFDVETDGEFEGLRIRTGQLRLGEVALALTGEVNHLQDPVRSVSLALAGEDLPLPDLMAVLPDSLRDGIPVQAEGLLAANLRVEGEAGPGHIPTVTGNVNLTRGQISLDGSRIAEGLTADLEVNPDQSILSRTQATLLGGPFSLEGSTTLGSGGSVDLALQATPDLSALGSVLELPEGVTVGGQISPQLRITGPVGDLRGLRFRGNVPVSGVRATHPNLGVPVEIPEGEIQFSGIGAVIQELPLLLGEDQVLLSGELSDVFAFLLPEETPRFEGTLRGSRLNLPELSARPLPDPDLTYGRVAFAKVGDRPIAGLGFQAAAEELGLIRPDSLPLAGSLALALDTVIDSKGRMEDVRARVDFGPRFLQVAEATFRRFGGEIRTVMDLTLGPDEAVPFSFSLQVQELEAGSFLSHTTPLGDFVRGTISVDMDIIGTMDGFLLPDRPALVGSGSFSLTGGGLNSTALTRMVADYLGLESLREPNIQDWGSSFVLEQGRVRLAEATIQGAPGSPEVGGSVGLNGDLDLRSAFALPTERLSTSALNRLGVAGEIAANVAQRPDVVQAILRIGGSVFDPAVEADPMSAAQTLGQAVEEEVRDEVQGRIDAEKAEAERVLEEQRAEAQRKIEEQKEELRDRASGFLQNLIRPRDTVQAPPPPDTVPPDTIRPDTVQLDTIQPDTLLPDSVQPDTVRPDTTLPDTTLPDTLRPDTLPPDTLTRVLPARTLHPGA